MIRKVESELEQELFNQIWMKVWDEKGFEHETSEGDSYLLYVDGNAAGTMQFVPYNESTGEQIDGVFDFGKMKKIRAHKGQIFIIDKFAIAKEYRSTHVLDLLMFNLFQYAEQRNQLYAIALLDPLFYRLLRFQYHFQIEKAGEKTAYKGAEVIPIMMDSYYFLGQREQYAWYKEAALTLSS